MPMEPRPKRSVAPTFASGGEPAPTVTDARTVKTLRWPIVFFLMFASLPAGLFTVIAIDARRVVHETGGPRPKTISESSWVTRHESAANTFRQIRHAAIATVSVHLLVSTLFFTLGNRLVLGLRAVAWGVTCWAAAGAGAGLGLWLAGSH
jgi:hypothetical protein